MLDESEGCHVLYAYTDRYDWPLSIITCACLRLHACYLDMYSTHWIECCGLNIHSMAKQLSPSRAGRAMLVLYECSWNQELWTCLLRWAPTIATSPRQRQVLSLFFIIHVLLQFGTALSDAKAEGHTDVVHLLQQYGHTDWHKINTATLVVILTTHTVEHTLFIAL